MSINGDTGQDKDRRKSRVRNNRARYLRGRRGGTLRAARIEYRLPGGATVLKRMGPEDVKVIETAVEPAGQPVQTAEDRVLEQRIERSAARLRITLDGKLGRPTPDSVKKLARGTA
ncbi:hypothetical protein [Arthrobacter sp.]|uniref:hypothetical protein n=1 Tax=Arthrobacter sp. TaxID=1667 RepID=UPI003A94DF99